LGVEEPQETTTQAAEEARPTDPPVEAETPPQADAPAAEPEAPAAEPEAPAAEPEAPVAQEEERPVDPPAEAEAPPAEAQAPPPPPIDTEQPRVGPKIVGIAEEKPPPIAVIKRLQDPRRPRRKRPNAAEKHRRAFFARLNELRGSRSTPKQAKPQAEEAAPPPQEPQAEATETEAVEAIEAAMPVEAGSVPEAPVEDAEQPAAEAEQPAAEAEQPAAEGEQPAAEAEQPAEESEPPLSEETPARRQARLAAAIERVGGAEIVRQALQPKRDDDGNPKKWAVVCCDASMGLKPGDPTFNAWVRLAATPVREIKGLVRPDDDREQRRGRRRGPRREGGEGRSGGRREGGERGPRRERVSREEIRGAQDGSFKPTIRIIGLEDQNEDRKERERRRKDEREAKRKAERERLERLGY
jgi:hypothetical protein